MSFSNFGQSINTRSTCYRFDKEAQLSSLPLPPNSHGFLVRGSGLSYSDCCVNDEGGLLDVSRLNHLISFDESTGVAVCQAGALFADLFLVNPDYIPPVIPGTLYATLGGGVANDIHGKNNTQQGTLGHHIQWLDLQINGETIRCSLQDNPDLFMATLGGLGLTGIIKRLAIKLNKAPRYVMVEKEKPTNWVILLQRLKETAADYDYQVAWLDILNPRYSILSYANHSSLGTVQPSRTSLKLPKIPLRLLYPWNIKLFNQCYYKRTRLHPMLQSLQQFNNPLDQIKHWNYLFGKKGLLQFQAVFAEECALDVLEKSRQIIITNSALPTLTVLKYFNQTSLGLLSFSKPGFTLAIDFVNNSSAKAAIQQMNQLITDLKGKIYLAKDLFLTTTQFKQQYPTHQRFKQLLSQYPSSLQSNLSRRLGITP